MNKKGWVPVLVTLLLLLSVILSACDGSSTTPAAPEPAPVAPEPVPVPAAEPITLKFASTMSSGSGFQPALELWCEEVGKRTDGRVTVEMYPGGTLFKMNAAMDSIAAGVADIGNITTGSYSDRFRLANITSLPALGYPCMSFESHKNASGTFMKMLDEIPEVKAEFAGYKVLDTVMFDNSIPISAKKQIRVPADLKGLKVGGAGEKVKIADAAGGVSVRVIVPQGYEALSKNLVDACIFTWGQAGAVKLQEVADYFCNYDVGGSMFPILMNENSWNKIAPEDQQIMLAAWDEIHPQFAEYIWQNMEDGKAAVKASGKTIYEVTPEDVALWQEAAKPVWDDYIASIKSKGSQNPEAVLERWKGCVDEAYEKYG